MSLTLEEVRRARLRMAYRGAIGYEVGDADTFIDRVKESSAQFENKWDLLRQGVETARMTGDPAPVGSDEILAVKDHKTNSPRGEIKRLRNQVAQQAKQQVPMVTPGQLDDKRVMQFTQNNERFRGELDRIRRELGEARSSRISHTTGNTETLQVAIREETTPAVTRLVSLAIEQARRLADEANNEAQRRINETKQQTCEITADARARVERIKPEAQVNTGQVNCDAQNRVDRINGEVGRCHTELLVKLEREQGTLAQKVATLRGFKSSCRENMRGYLS